MFNYENMIRKKYAGQTHYKRFSVMLVRRSGAWFKKALLWLLRSGSSIVSIPHKACSALLRGFESRNRDWESKISDFYL